MQKWLMVKQRNVVHFEGILNVQNYQRSKRWSDATPERSFKGKQTTRGKL